ncbi:hypothetical protein LX36DRAFT_660683 [Colletotrichum falcatum]|nr:hypothetical protein LX36DRAFT_660683 [Colletotrichum falcatum]
MASARRRAYYRNSKAFTQQAWKVFALPFLPFPLFTSPLLSFHPATTTANTTTTHYYYVRST